MKSERLNYLNKKCEKLVLVSKVTLTKTNEVKIKIKTNAQNLGNHDKVGNPESILFIISLLNAQSLYS